MLNKSQAGHREKDETFFERNKTLIGAVVSILIAGMGFGSALGVSYFQREAEGNEKTIAAATDLDTSAVLVNSYVGETILVRDWLGMSIKRSEAQLRRDMADTRKPLELRDEYNELIDRGRRLSQDLWAKVGTNYSPIRGDMVRVLLSLDALLDAQRSLRSAVSLPFGGLSEGERKTQSELLQLQYDSLAPYAEILLCDVSSLHQTYSLMMQEHEIKITNAWSPTLSASDCGTVRSEAHKKFQALTEHMSRTFPGRDLKSYHPTYGP
jgi:hypothetical protein